MNADNNFINIRGKLFGFQYFEMKKMNADNNFINIRGKIIAF